MQREREGGVYKRILRVHLLPLLLDGPYGGEKKQWSAFCSELC